MAQGEAFEAIMCTKEVAVARSFGTGFSFKLRVRGAVARLLIVGTSRMTSRG